MFRNLTYRANLSCQQCQTHVDVRDVRGEIWFKLFCLLRRVAQSFMSDASTNASTPGSDCSIPDSIAGLRLSRKQKLYLRLVENGQLIRHIFEVVQKVLVLEKLRQPQHVQLQEGMFQYNPESSSDSSDSMEYSGSAFTKRMIQRSLAHSVMMKEIANDIQTLHEHLKKKESETMNSGQKRKALKLKRARGGKALKKMWNHR